MIIMASIMQVFELERDGVTRLYIYVHLYL